MPAAPQFKTTASQPPKLKVRIAAVGDELHLRWRGSGGCVALFLGVWLTGWSAGCVTMLYQLVTNFEWFMLLFSIPFVVAWVAVAGMLAYMLFGSQHLILSRDSLRTFHQVVFPFFSRVIPLEEVDRAFADEVFEQNSKGPGRYVGLIRIDTIGKSTTFARGIDESERVWLAEVINLCLDQIAPYRAARTDDSVAADKSDADLLDPNDDGDEEEVEYQEEVFELPDQPIPRPSDSEFTLERESRTLGLATRGKWSLAAIAPLTLIMLFWNGIVSVFIVQLFSSFEWPLFFFLIPFEVIGLGVVAAWLAAIGAPFIGKSYSFRVGQIEQVWWFALFHRRKTIVFTEISQLVIASSAPKQSSLRQFGKSEHLTGGHLLRLTDTEGVTVVEIDNLTRGDARWIADTLWRELPEMFSRQARRTG